MRQTDHPRTLIQRYFWKTWTRVPAPKANGDMINEVGRSCTLERSGDEPVDMMEDVIEDIERDGELLGKHPSVHLLSTHMCKKFKPFG